MRKLAHGHVVARIYVLRKYSVERRRSFRVSQRIERGSSKSFLLSVQRLPLSRARSSSS